MTVVFNIVTVAICIAAFATAVLTIGADIVRAFSRH